jgi:hypothetical protein
MASWKADYFGTKTAVATALGAATLSQAISFDPGQPLNVSDATTLAHFAAAIAMAQGALGALNGAAPNAKVAIWGYRDLSVVAGGASGATGSKIKCEVDEFWPY